MDDLEKGTQRVECVVVGKVIGSMTGLDIVDDMCLYIYDFSPNELGAKFLRGQVVVENDSLTVHLDTAEVILNKYQETPDSEYKFTVINPDWSVFNKEISDASSTIVDTGMGVAKP